jgi:Icc-related predicted phosphoesterase
MSDLHGSETALKESRELLEEHSPDLFLVTGDITNFGPLDYARKLFSDIPVRALAIPGNCDPLEIVPLLEEMGISLHGRKVVLQGETIIGLGGSSPTPFHTPFELSEEEILSSLEPLMETGAILATHSPPRGHVDYLEWSGHVGSSSIERLVEEYRPRLVLCGHIHEARGVERGATIFVNPGPASRGYAAVVDVEDEVEVALLP